MGHYVYVEHLNREDSQLSEPNQKNIKQTSSGNSNNPVVWKLNMTQNSDGNYNNQNSCTFSLSSSEYMRYKSDRRIIGNEYPLIVDP